jgi:cytochrome c-type biogenesis protein CcmE
MNKHHQRRLIYVCLLLASLAIAIGLILFALKQNINVFLTPSQLTTAQTNSDYNFRLGGLVKQGSVKRDADGLGVEFVVTDFKRDLRVRYQGVLPDLFREGKGMVAEGHMTPDGVFLAAQVLAKHDENYMPKNVANVINNNTSGS